MPRSLAASISVAMAAAVAEAIPTPQARTALVADLFRTRRCGLRLRSSSGTQVLIRPFEVRDVAFELIVGRVLIRHRDLVLCEHLLESPNAWHREGGCAARTPGESMNSSRCSCGRSSEGTRCQSGAEVSGLTTRNANCMAAMQSSASNPAR